MKKAWMFWALATIITLSAAYYQRTTGPTYPRSGKFIDNVNVFKYKLQRTCDTGKNLEIRIPIKNNTQGYLFYKRNNTPDKFTVIKMNNQNDTLIASLPTQPPAGKLLYTIRLLTSNEKSVLTENPVVARFKGSVPLYILIPHILFMFLAMFFSNYTGLIAIGNRPKKFKWAIVTIVITFIGGLILGPVVQKYAFGELWTGIPFGWDLTDNKTLIGFAGWVIAIIANYKKERRGWFIFAAILTLIVYSIPHSMFGSQLDYNSGVIKQG